VKNATAEVAAARERSKNARKRLGAHQKNKNSWERKRRVRQETVIQKKQDSKKYYQKEGGGRGQGAREKKHVVPPVLTTRTALGSGPPSIGSLMECGPIVS